MKGRHTRAVIVGGCMASALSFAQAATAQTAAPPPVAPPQATAPTDTAIDDIVVTAERREQSVQKTPLTIQVVSGSDLARGGVTDVAALQKLTPGVNIGMSGGNSQIYIRGVGGFAVSPLSSPGVAFNVDGIYVGRPDGVNGNFYDIARIEVLKGPQGTLYGRNANGGSINVITNEAKLGERTLDLGFEGGNYKLLHVNGAINLSIGDTLAIRGAFNVVNRDGYLSGGENDDIQQSGRLRLRWEPSSDVTIRLNADYTHLGGRGNNAVYRPQRPGASPYESMSEPAANAYMHGAGPLGPLLKDLQNDTFLNTTLFNLSGQLDWKLPFATLTVLPAYRYGDSRYKNQFGEDYTSYTVTRQRTLEARLGNSSSRLTWVLGGYYFNETSPDGLVLVDGGNIIQNYRIIYSPTTTSYAAFGQATLTVLPGFRAIGGIRYTYEHRTLSGSITDVAVTPSRLLEAFGGDKSFEGVTWKAGAEIDLAPRSMLYATYSTGFKSGGFSQTVAPLNVFKPERLDAFEVGSRNRFFDNRLQLNVSGFYWKYKDIQDQRVNFDPLGNVNFITFNSGSATLYGANIDLVARPTSADTISLNGEYTHSAYDSFYFQTPVPFFQPGSSGCRLTGPYLPGATLPYSVNGSNINNGPLPVTVGNCQGFQVARVPTWTGTLSYQHVITLKDDGRVTIGGSVKYASGSWLNIDFIEPERQHPYAVVDADLGYEAPDGKWSVGLFARNLTKTVYYTGGLETSFIGGLVVANIAAPRTYGLRASIRFGR